MFGESVFSYKLFPKCFSLFAFMIMSICRCSGIRQSYSTFTAVASSKARNGNCGVLLDLYGQMVSPYKHVNSFREATMSYLRYYLFRLQRFSHDLYFWLSCLHSLFLSRYGNVGCNTEHEHELCWLSFNQYKVLLILCKYINFSYLHK